ncbi:amidase [Actinomyces sp. 432]|uniref:amidase n=1 Tax=Actinomyces sp. 432 TaxID=2057798 RepID=UPI001373D802|nr:amidase family protein [Actinomyces sp. 432]QHO90456.1 amidase [Actinomyces sp. 432]
MTIPRNAVDIAHAVSAGHITARATIQAALERIDALDPGLNAFTAVRREAALREADVLDRRIAAAGPSAAGPLAGVPVAVKEEYDVAGEVTTVGGRGNSNPAQADCAVVRRLRQAGAIIVGRTNMPEFGQFPVGESAYHGDCLNPWDPARSPGGSSAGSAVAVATGAVPVAMGADGGGSLRIPASACGVLGLKPTRGRVSSAPLDEHWFGLASFGAITRTAHDLAVVMDVVSGNEPVDRWRLDAPTRRFIDAVSAPPPQLRILSASNAVMPGARPTPAITQSVRSVSAVLQGLGHDVRPARVAWPVPTAPFLTLYFAGMHVEAQQVEHPNRLESRTRTSARLGALIPQPVVRAALSQAKRVHDGVEAAFGRADLLLLPTLLDLPGAAHDLHGKSWLSAMLASTPTISNTAIFNVSGHPALSVPAGFSHGLPVGAQLVARAGREDLLLAVAAQLHTH